MKKTIKICSILLCIFILSGCNEIGTKVTTCTHDNDQSKSGYKILSTYKIYSKKDIVTKVETNEVLTTKNTTILAFFEDDYKKKYESESKKYKGFSYKINKEKEKLTTNLIVNYKKLNMSDYIKENSAMKSYVDKNNNFTLNGAKTMYESLGATCK